MTQIERKLPSDNNMCLRFLVKRNKDLTLENYAAACEESERGIEKSLMNTLSRVTIEASVKTDRCSLPYNNEVVVTLGGSSFMNDAFEVHRVARKVVKELLDKNVFQLRFYVFVEVVDGRMGFGSINYHFRYHLRNN